MTKRRKKKTKKATSEEERFKNAPHSFVIHRGNVGSSVMQLVRDFRLVMEPYTASKLKPKKQNVLKDFVSIAGPLNVSHLVTFSCTEISVNMRVIKLPHGPTLSFKVKSYSLMRDVLSSLKKKHTESGQYMHHPLLILSGFSSPGRQIELALSMFQSMFPSLNINQLSLPSIKRCLLVSYSSDSDSIEIRHYNISVSPQGLSKPVNNILSSKIPDLGSYRDISDYIAQGGNPSESEAEMDDPESHIEKIKEGKAKNLLSTGTKHNAVRLTELGPRLTLQLYKIEEGMCSGDILYHQFVQKTDQQKKEAKRKREQKIVEKIMRRKQQEANVIAKQKKKKLLSGISDSQKKQSSIPAPKPGSKRPRSVTGSETKRHVKKYRRT